MKLQDRNGVFFSLLGWGYHIGCMNKFHISVFLLLTSLLLRTNSSPGLGGRNNGILITKR